MLAQMPGALWDVQFFVFAARELVRLEERSSTASILLSKVKFEEHKAAGNIMCIKAQETQVGGCLLPPCTFDRNVTLTLNHARWSSGRRCKRQAPLWPNWCSWALSLTSTQPSARTPSSSSC